MAQISKPPIPLKVYRHFAVVTVMLTATLALFALEAPKQSATPAPAQAGVAAQGQKAPSSAAGRPAGEPAYGRAELVDRRGGGGSGSFGDEAGPGGGYGRPNISRPRDRLLSFSETPAADSENAAFTQAYLDSLSDEELAALLEALRASGIQSSADRERIANVMETASRRRSGRGQGSPGE